jgi:hypothetical protein
MLRRIVYLEDDGNFWIKAVDVQRRIVGLGVEDEAIGSIGHWLRHKEKRFHASVSVCPRMSQFGPGLVRVLYFKTNSHSISRGTPRSVEDVG